MPKINKNKPLKNYLSILSGHGFASLFAFILNYFAASKLGPTFWGLWQQAVILQRGLNLSNLGSADFITRELALKNEGVERSNEERNMIFHSILISFFILFLACLIIFLNFNFVNSNLFIKYILIMSFVSAIGIVSGNVLVAERQVQNYSLVLIITGITHFLGVLLVYFFSIQGFLSWVILIALIPAIAGAYFLRINTLRITEFKSILSLIFNSRHFFIAALLVFLAHFIDRILISNFFGIDKLGTYSLALLIATPLHLVISASDKTFYPMIVNKFGFQEDFKSATIFSFTYLKILLPLSLSFIFAMIALFIFIEPILFSEFEINYLILSNTVLAYTFLYICSPGASALAAIGKMYIYNIILSAQIILVVILSFGSSFLGFGLMEFSFIILFSNFLMWSACTISGIGKKQILTKEGLSKILPSVFAALFFVFINFSGNIIPLDSLKLFYLSILLVIIFTFMLFLIEVKKLI